MQQDWLKTAEGDPIPEKTIPLAPPGALRRRRGRMDLFIEADDRSGYVVVVEIKATDWDLVKHVQRLLGAHRRQVWKYIEKYLDQDKIDVVPGIIYPSAPTTPGLKEEVETYLNEYGLQVVGFDDP